MRHVCDFFAGGALFVDMDVTSYNEIEARHQDLLSGGRWTPTNCSANHRVAILVPYRDRDAHLKIFLAHMHPFLQRQLLEYTIYVVEQVVGRRYVLFFKWTALIRFALNCVM